MNVGLPVHPLLALLLAPLLQGVITRVKARFAGRDGPPLLQPYYDLAKLLAKGAVYSETTTWVFRLAPVAGVAITALCLLFMPLGHLSPGVAFAGDVIFIVYLLGLHRFLTVLAAMDTGSAFEGMGASREMAFAALAEPALLFALAALAHVTGNLSLAGIIHDITPALWHDHAPTFLLILAGLFLVFLAENSRIPVDDPTTHLELTMIHEVMVLDHSGPDFAFIEYAASLKLWLLGALITGIALPIDTGWLPFDTAAMVLALFVLAALVGVVESTMARLRMLQVPQLLVGACAFAIVGFLVY